MNINFETSTVSFIDVIGYGSLVRKACREEDSMKKLNSLVGAINETLNKGLPGKKTPPEHKPTVFYYSDSIVLHLYEHKVGQSENYTSSDVIVINSLLIYQHLIKYGFFVRGCINKDLAWCDGSNIIGPAYMDAYAGEGKLSFPAIILNDSAADDCKFSEMITSYKGNRYVNVFNDNFLKDLNLTIYQSITDILKNQMTLASQNYNQSQKKKHKIKWLGLIDFLLQTSTEKEILELYASELGLDQPLEDYRADSSM